MVAMMQRVSWLLFAQDLANAESWYKTITEERHGTSACLDLPKGDVHKGNLIQMMGCSGGDSQKWVFDNYQIRYGVDERYCIDAANMTDGAQPTLEECNSLPQQTWGYDSDAMRVYIANTTVCLDWLSSDDWDDDDHLPPLILWQCNGLNNQRWNVSDSGPPLPQPPPPAPPAPPAPAPPSPSQSRYHTITPTGTNLCVDLPGGDVRNGNLLWLWECTGGDAQKWVFDNYQIRYGSDEGYCIDALGMADGVQLMLAECNGRPPQAWGYDSDAMRLNLSYTTQCLDWYDGDMDNGQPLHVWQCNGLGNQQWSLVNTSAPSPPSPSPAPPSPAWPIMPTGSTDLCADLPGGDVRNGNLLWLWECSGGTSQKWVFDNYQIRYGANESYCIDAADMSDGVQLMLWDCNGLPQQTWGYDSFDMRVYIASTPANTTPMCLDWYDGDVDNGQPLLVRQLDPLGNQQWSVWDLSAPSPPSPSILRPRLPVEGFASQQSFYVV